MKLDFPHNTLRVLKVLYHPPLVLLVLSPLFVGFFINYKLSNASYIWVNLIWMLLFTLPFGFFQKRLFYRLIVCYYFLVGFVEICHWIIIGGPLRVNSVLVMANTNLEEAAGFFDLQSTYSLLLLIPFVLLAIFTFRHPPKIFISKANTYPLIALSLVLAIFMGYVATAKDKQWFMPRAISVSYIFSKQFNAYKKALGENLLKEVEAKVDSKKQQIFVLILGESGSKNHMSLYGFQKTTTPLLDNRKDIIVYGDAISGYSLTRESIPAMLSEANLENKMDFYECTDLLDIFHSAGFKTYWISNQSPTGIFDNAIGRYAKKCDYTRFVDATDKSALQVILDTSYDIELIEPFIEVLDEDVEKKFIVLHLMGTHAAYYKRYPADFDVFTGNTSKEKTIAEYHNAMRYNDFIVDSLLTVLKSKTEPLGNAAVSALYISDHGENLYDEQERVGHAYAEQIPKSNVEIPFFVWLSQNYIGAYPEKTEMIISNRDMPFVTDDLFHTIMDINHIQSPIFKEERSVFNAKYNRNRLRILVDGVDYDKK